MRAFFAASVLTLLFLSGCDFPFFTKSEKPALPLFDGSAAFQTVVDYERLGPAIPGSAASRATGDWIVARLKAAGVQVIEQTTTAKTFDQHTIPVRNLLGRIQPEAKTRYLLSAHWDARPFADEDQNPKNRRLPVPAANDGGSGVAILLGIAEALKGNSPPFGIDLLFLDAEDWGSPGNEASYCLGTQYFAKNPIPAGYTAQFGIHFDMVGRIGATFPIEGYTEQRAGSVLARIHAAAAELGYSDAFPKLRVGPIIDDHLYLMEGLRFPVADLIHMDGPGRFPPEWHTTKDTSAVISRETLKIVGQTTLKVLWNSN